MSTNLSEPAGGFIISSRQTSEFLENRTESVLLPGEVRVPRPEELPRPSPMDWTRMDSVNLAPGTPLELAAAGGAGAAGGGSVLLDVSNRDDAGVDWAVKHDSLQWDSPNNASSSGAPSNMSKSGGGVAAGGSSSAEGGGSGGGASGPLLHTPPQLGLGSWASSLTSEVTKAAQAALQHVEALSQQKQQQQQQVVVVENAASSSSATGNVQQQQQLGRAQQPGRKQYQHHHQHHYDQQQHQYQQHHHQQQYQQQYQQHQQQQQHDLHQQSSSASSASASSSALQPQMTRRSAAQMMNEELLRESRLFPPPPAPPSTLLVHDAPVAGEGDADDAAPQQPSDPSLVSRFELWHYHASQWDITHTTPPPPRNPKEAVVVAAAGGSGSASSSSSSSVPPYDAAYWMNRCEHWASHIAKNFQYPPSNNALRPTMPAMCSENVLLENVCVA